MALVAAPVSQQAGTQEAAASSLEGCRSMDAARFGRFFAPEAAMFFPDDPFPQDARFLSRLGTPSQNRQNRTGRGSRKTARRRPRCS